MRNESDHNPRARRVLLIERHNDGGTLESLLEASRFSVVRARTRDDALAVLGNGFRPRIVILGDDGRGDIRGALSRIREIKPGIPVLVLVERGESGESYREHLVEVVQRQDAPVELPRRLEELLEGARDFADEKNEVAADGTTFVVGSPAMVRIHELVQQVADTDVTVLITGESGVGKEVIARALHRNSDRKDRPFLKVNCAALPDQLLESELFGHERGAFTGAVRRKPGKFELADGGTIFLDEIGEIEGQIQAKLLQVLQDGGFFRVGGETEISVDARVIASTNRDLEASMASGAFRKDLFFRLNVVRIEVPQLAERKEEIHPLAEHFRRRYEAEYGRRVGELPPDVIEALRRHDWPGNVRELENVVRRMVVLEDIAGVADTLVRADASGTSVGFDVDALIGDSGGIPPLKEVSRLAALEVEGQLIRRALEQTGWNRRQAALLLNISYKALLYKIRDCGITPPLRAAAG